MNVTDRVIELRLNNEEWPLSRIGKEVGRSRERVRQILKQQQLPTKAHILSNNLCPLCNHKKLDKHQEFCSRCNWLRIRDYVYCSYCGHKFMRKISEIKRNANQFCSREHYYNYRRGRSRNMLKANN
ncbi:MAG: sigma factor-like helix-turn-helix DNA-binding protein [Thermodesulfobacteriota bacterium]